MVPLTSGGCDFIQQFIAFRYVSTRPTVGMRRQTDINDGKSQTKLLMRCLGENSHLKHNNSNGEQFFIMFFTLKAIPGRFWEPCQVGGEPQISGMCLGKWLAPPV